LWVRQRGRHDCRDLRRLRGDGPSRTRLLLHTSEAGSLEACEPGADRDLSHVAFLGHRRYTRASTSAQNDGGTLNVARRRSA